MGLIAEDLLLLLLDDEKGHVVGTSHLQPVLGGAVLIELATTGAVVVEEKKHLWKSAKVRVQPENPPADDELLRRSAGIVAEKERSGQDLVNRLGKGVKDDLLARLERRGIVERREEKVFGLFPRTRWPAVDSSHEDAVRRDLTAALVQGVQPEQRTACLIALLSTIDRAHKVVDRDGLPASQVRKRAKEIAKSEWAAKAVKDAIAASTAAVSAAVAAATTGATAAGN